MPRDTEAALQFEGDAMASNDLRFFQWYQKYVVKAADLTNVVSWLRGMSEGTAEGAFGGSVLQGCSLSVDSALTTNIGAGIAVSPSGRIVVIAAATATFASPSGNPAKSLVVARPKLTDTTSIPEPTNPSNSVYLYKKFEYDLIVLNGSPSATPVYPSVQADDVIVCAVKLAAGQTTLTYADYDFGKIDRPRKKINKVLGVSSSYTMDGGEDIIEVDASAASALLTLPAPADVVGQKYTVVKIDSSSNLVAVSGTAISGQQPVELDTQWQTLTFYSNGSSYRSI